MRAAKGLDELLQGDGRPRNRAFFRAPAQLGRFREPIPTSTAGRVRHGKPLDIARQLTTMTISGFMCNWLENRGKALAVETPPGVGKSKSAADAIGAARVNGRVLAGTVQLAREQAQEHRWTLIEGRNSDNCARYPVAKALGVLGHDVERNACGTLDAPRCPSRASCPYYEQFEAAGTRVGTAEQLFNPRFLKGGQVLVLDDIAPLRSCIEIRSIDASGLLKARVRLPAPAARLAEIVALACSPGDGRVVTGAAVWDRLAEEAAAQGEDLDALVEQVAGLELAFEPVPENPTGVLTVTDVERAPSAITGRLLRTLVEEHDSFRSCEEFNCRMRLIGDRIEMGWLRPHAAEPGGASLVSGMAMLLLDATPVAAITDHLFEGHVRLPPVRAEVGLPEAVHVIQYATGGNGHVAMRDAAAVDRIVREVEEVRSCWPVEPGTEAFITYKELTPQLERRLGTTLNLTYGNLRGTNVLIGVRRIHLIGRPWPPSHDIAFLAQVIHHDECEAVIPAQEMQRRAIGGQRLAIEVLDFVDPRASEVLAAVRDAELQQALHRARLFCAPEDGRELVCVVLHGCHPVDGLRVDEVRLGRGGQDLNSRRETEAAERVWAAVAELDAEGMLPTPTAVARCAGAHPKTVRKVLGQGAVAGGIATGPAASVGNDDHTVKESIKGVIISPNAFDGPWTTRREACSCMRDHNDVTSCGATLFEAEADGTLHCAVCHPQRLFREDEDGSFHCPGCHPRLAIAPDLVGRMQPR